MDKKLSLEERFKAQQKIIKITKKFSLKLELLIDVK